MQKKMLIDLLDYTCCLNKFLYSSPHIEVQLEKHPRTKFGFYYTSYCFVQSGWLFLGKIELTFTKNVIEFVVFYTYFYEIKKDYLELVN